MWNYKDLIWRNHHHRFGLAGEGQADAVAAILEAHRGAVAYIGCGPFPNVIQTLSRHCSYLLALDASFGALRLVSETSVPNVWKVAGTASAIPCRKADLDHIVAFGLLGYIEDLPEMFADFRSVLRPGGMAMLTDRVSRPAEHVIKSASAQGFALHKYMEGYSPGDAGGEESRYLLILESRP
jgi:trans-aconitate methyltransferase